jgi:hypothetical protein
MGYALLAFGGLAAKKENAYFVVKYEMLGRKWKTRKDKKNAVPEGTAFGDSILSFIKRDSAGLSDHLHVFCVGSLLVHNDFELNLFAFLEILYAFSDDGRKMNKDILRTVVGFDEAVTFGPVEPLYNSCRHKQQPF